MSVASSVQKGDFDLNLVSLRKPLVFPDGTIQDTAYTGDGSEDLAEVLAVGNDALGQDITGVGVLEVNTQIELTPTGNTVNFNGEINQVALGVGFNGNQLQPTLISSNQGQGAGVALIVNDNAGGDGLLFLPNANNNIYNPIVQAGDILIVSNSNTQSLAICCDSATTNGVRITDTTMLMGAGGNADTPSQNITFNNPANTIKATTTTGFYASSSTIEPNPTLAVQDVPSGQATYHIPKANAGNYNPITQANNQQIVAWGSAGINTQTLEIVPHSATSCGIKLSPTTCEIGAGGGATDPSNRITFVGTGTLEYGQSHQFVNGVAQYDAVGQANRIVPSCPSTSATIPPSFEFQSVRITGNAGSVSGNIILSKNITATSNYAVFPTIYYGYTGSGGTYDALGTSGTMNPIVISAITSTQFTYNFTKGTGDNVNMDIQFLIVYQIAGSDYAKTWS